MKDYYQILGVKRTATAAEIKKAYRRLAKQYHPDSQSETEEKKRRFQEISEAYRVLSDEEARKQYNAWGHETYTRQAKHKAYEGEGEDGHCGACQKRNPRPKEEGPPPYSVRTAVHMTFAQVLTGAKKTATVKYKEDCPHCKGEGRAALGDQKEKCPFCKGTGILERQREVRVRIPARTYDGCFYFLDDVLDPAEEPIPQKNIVVIVLVDDQPEYIRHNYHLYSTLEVDYPQLALGGEIQIPTIDGTVSYVLAPGTPAGARIRLAGQGLWMPPKVGNRGDLHVTLQVVIPKALNDRQARALRQFWELLKAGDREKETEESEKD